MTKFSAVPPNASPALGDYLLGVTSGNVDNRVAISALKSLMFPARIRRVSMSVGVDATGAAQFISEFGQSIKFPSGSNPAYFMRSAVKLPTDVTAATAGVIKFLFYSVAGAPGTIPFQYYVGAHPAGDSLTTEWNLASALTITGVAYSANVLYEVTIPTTIPLANMLSGQFIGIAIKPNAVLGADSYMSTPTLEYTADS